MNESARTLRVAIRINDSVMQKLIKYSEALGMAPSTVAAQFVCEGLLAKDRQAYAMEKLFEQQVKQMGEMSLELFNDPEKIALIAKNMGIAEQLLLDK